jgi:hypothetical protein
LREKKLLKRKRRERGERSKRDENEREREKGNESGGERFTEYFASNYRRRRRHMWLYSLKLNKTDLTSIFSSKEKHLYTIKHNYNGIL